MPKEKTNEIKAGVILTDTTTSISSVKLTRTAGNEVRPEVKVYDIDPTKAEKTAMDIMDRLNKKYRVNE